MQILEEKKKKRYNILCLHRANDTAFLCSKPSSGFSTGICGAFGAGGNSRLACSRAELVTAKQGGREIFLTGLSVKIQQ